MHFFKIQGMFTTGMRYYIYHVYGLKEQTKSRDKIITALKIHHGHKFYEVNINLLNDFV